MRTLACPPTSSKRAFLSSGPYRLRAFGTWRIPPRTASSRHECLHCARAGRQPPNEPSCMKSRARRSWPRRRRAENTAPPRLGAIGSAGRSGRQVATIGGDPTARARFRLNCPLKVHDQPNDSRHAEHPRHRAPRAWYRPARRERPARLVARPRARPHWPVRPFQHVPADLAAGGPRSSTSPPPPACTTSCSAAPRRCTCSPICFRFGVGLPAGSPSRRRSDD